MAEDFKSLEREHKKLTSDLSDLQRERQRLTTTLMSTSESISSSERTKAKNRADEVDRTIDKILKRMVLVDQKMLHAD